MADFISLSHVWLIFFTILFLKYIWSRRRIYYLSWILPGSLALPLIGNFFSLIKRDGVDIYTFLAETTRRYRKVCRFWAFSDMYVMVADADIAYQINKISTKSNIYQYFGLPFTKGGILIDNDIAHWKSSRKTIMHTFSFENLKSYVQIFHDESLHFIKKLEPYSNTGKSFYIPHLLKEVTYRAILRTSFKLNPPREDCGKARAICRGIGQMFQHSQTRIVVPIFKHLWIYKILGFRKKELKSINTVLEGFEGYLREIISQDEGSNNTSEKSFVNAMIADPQISTQEIVAQMIFVLTGGMDTTSSTISIALLMLALFPEVQDKVCKEVVHVLGDDLSILPTYADLMRLEYMDRVIKECLRLYPAVPLVSKQSETDISFNVDGKQYTVPAGVPIAILIHTIHTDPEYYKNPTHFDPDRWLAENMESHNPHAFFPFSNGPRTCIGEKYFLLQIKTVLSTVVRKYEILKADSCQTLEDIRTIMVLTLQLDKNCQIKIKERKMI